MAMGEPMHVRCGERGQGLVELALTLPVMLIMFVTASDFARVYFADVTVTNAARNGAQYAALSAANAADTSGIRDAVLEEATDLSSEPTVGVATGTDALGNQYVEVTVAYNFDTLMNLPGLPGSYLVSRKLRMEVSP